MKFITILNTLTKNNGLKLLSPLFLTKGYKTTISMLLVLSVSSLAFEQNFSVFSFIQSLSMKPLNVASNMVTLYER